MFIYAHKTHIYFVSSFQNRVFFGITVDLNFKTDVADYCNNNQFSFVHLEFDESLITDL